MIFWSSLKAPAQEYFQQKVNYEIQVTLDDQRNELNAFETIDYTNNSKDTLQFLFFHLWPNAYSGNNTALVRQLFRLNGKQKLFNDPELRGFIDSLNFKIDGLQANWNLLTDQPDICKIILNKSLKPGDSIKITTPFHVKIPKGVTSRLGHIGESYQISQWYPKPAVYDRSGWHQMPYLDQGEFYSEFGNFDVSITLPENYIVGATGNLQDSRELEMLNQIATDTTWKSNLDEGNDHFPPSSPQMKTLRYTESRVHDFAWFADKRFHVLKGKIKLPDSGREVITWLMFTNKQAELWKDAIPYINHAIGYFSKWLGDYPYNNFTAVQSALNAGVGMEYPGITVVGFAEDGYNLDQVITHEAGHNWFYGAIGSDERRYPFMDESITSAYEGRYMDERYPVKKLWEVYLKKRKQAKFFHVEDLPPQRMQEIQWLATSRTNLEQPINLAAPDYTTSNYGIILYNKAATGFNYLRAYLGDSLFDSAMHDYFHQWKFKHPQPDDLRKIVESHTYKNLNWFFDDFIGTTKRLDYKLVRLKNRQLLVKNNGELVSPLVIAGMIGDSIYFEKWIDGFEGQKWIGLPEGNYSEIKIDPRHVMSELFRLNNNIHQTGLFPRADPIRLQLLFTIEDPDKRTIMYIPAVNWNKENGFMAGIVLHNGFLLPKPLEYFLMPFYSFNNSDLAGFGKISWNIVPFNNFIRLATVTLEGTQFGAPGDQNYHKIKTGLELCFKPKVMNNPFRQKVNGYYIAASNLFQIEHQEKSKMSSYLQFGYQLEKTGFINPYNLLASFETGQSYQKTSVEFNYKHSYLGKNNGLDIRLFAGTMLKQSSDIPFYNLSASGRSGREQYLFQGTYPDRFSQFPGSFWTRQMTLSEGSLVSPVNDRLGYSRWLISLSFTSNLPGRAGHTPVKPFVNLLLNDHGLDTGQNSSFFYEAGLKAGIWDFFEVHVPLLVSGNIRSITGSFKDRIRIVLKLDSFNQLKMNRGKAD
jgi:hypothetical protein